MLGASERAQKVSGKEGTETLIPLKVTLPPPRFTQSSFQVVLLRNVEQFMGWGKGGRCLCWGIFM